MTTAEESRMKIYAVDYWVPFPSSEYGGLEIWTAQDRGSLVQLMLAAAEAPDYDYEREKYPYWQALVASCAESAQELTTEVSGLLASFYT